MKTDVVAMTVVVSVTEDSGTSRWKNNGRLSAHQAAQLLYTRRWSCCCVMMCLHGNRRGRENTAVCQRQRRKRLFLTSCQFWWSREQWKTEICSLITTKTDTNNNKDDNEHGNNENHLVNQCVSGREKREWVRCANHRCLFGSIQLFQASKCFIYIWRTNADFPSKVTYVKKLIITKQKSY